MSYSDDYRPDPPVLPAVARARAKADRFRKLLDETKEKLTAVTADRDRLATRVRQLRHGYDEAIDGLTRMTESANALERENAALKEKVAGARDLANEWVNHTGEGGPDIFVYVPPREVLGTAGRDMLFELEDDGTGRPSLRASMLEFADLVERPRCRTWSPGEIAWRLRAWLLGNKTPELAGPGSNGPGSKTANARCDCHVGTVPVFDDDDVTTGQRACIACGHVSEPESEPESDETKTIETEYVRGVTDARRLYAQAWADATGKPIEPVTFTYSYLREKVREMAEVAPELEAEVVVAERALARADLTERQLDHARAMLTPSAMGCECQAYAYAPGEMGLPDNHGHHPNCPDHVEQRLERLRAAIDRVVQGEPRAVMEALALRPGDLVDPSLVAGTKDS